MCKKRKIKCDEGQPHCQRCIKSKRDCPGYREKFDIMFRDENKALKKRDRKRRSIDHGNRLSNDQSIELLADIAIEPSPGFTAQPYTTLSPSAQPSTYATGRSADAPFFGSALNMFTAALRSGPIPTSCARMKQQAVPFSYYSQPNAGFEVVSKTAPFSFSAPPSSRMDTNEPLTYPINTTSPSLPMNTTASPWLPMDTTGPPCLPMDTVEPRSLPMDLTVSLPFEPLSSPMGPIVPPSFKPLSLSMSPTVSPPIPPQFDFNSLGNVGEISIPRMSMLNAELESVAFFFNNFIKFPQKQESMDGFLELLRPIYNQAKPFSAVCLATNAVALACAGNYPGRQVLLKEAMQSYGKAIRTLRQDVQNSKTSKLDETIMATLVLSLYEIIMSTNSSIDGWAHHVDGAVRLVTLRGSEQFNNSLSYSVFRAVRDIMISSCIQRGMPIFEFPGQTGWRGKDQGEENPASRLALIVLELADLRVRADSLRSEAYSPLLEKEARSMMITAHMIDFNLDQWYDTLPPNWHQRTDSTVTEKEMPENLKEANAWVGPQHVYEDLDHAGTMNDARVYRIYCHRVIQGCVKWLKNADGAVTDADQKAYDRATRVLQTIADEISASVPFFITYEKQPEKNRLGKEHYAAEAYGAYKVFWPVYIASITPTVPQRQRDWLVGRLEHMDDKFGLSAAGILSRSAPPFSSSYRKLGTRAPYRMRGTPVL